MSGAAKIPLFLVGQEEHEQKCANAGHCCFTSYCSTGHGGSEELNKVLVFSRVGQLGGRGDKNKIEARRKQVGLRRYNRNLDETDDSNKEWRSLMGARGAGKG